MVGEWVAVVYKNSLLKIEDWLLPELLSACEYCVRTHTYLKEQFLGRYDGGVEGSELTCSYEDTNITTNLQNNHQQQKKSLELARKDILHPKKKKKIQQDGRRHVIMIK